MESYIGGFCGKNFDSISDGLLGLRLISKVGESNFFEYGSVINLVKTWSREGYSLSLCDIFDVIAKTLAPQFC